METAKKDPKSLAALIVAGPKPPEMNGTAGAEDDNEDGIGEGEMAAAEEAMAALKSGDTRAFAESLKALVHLCSY